jgi:hypothetical protein
MKRATILPVLLAVVLAACGADDSERSAAPSDALNRAEEPPAIEQEQAIVTMEPAAAPPPTMGRASGGETSRPAADAPVQIATTDTVSAVPADPGVPPAPGQPSVSLNPMLIRSGTAQVQVDSLQQGIGQVRALAQRVGGIVGNTTISTGSEESRQATIELRIPSANFDRALTGLAPIGRVESVNVTAEDVGEEYTDVSARVANARRLESRLLDFYTPAVSLSRLREHRPVFDVPPELLLRALDPPKVVVRNVPLVDVLRSAYRNLASEPAEDGRREA